MKKLQTFFTLFLVIFSITSCSPKKVALSKAHIYEETTMDNVFKFEIIEYYDYQELCETNESFVTFIYNDKNCLCYLDLKTISLDYIVENNIVVYTIDLKVINGKNTYGYNVNNHSYPSICIYEDGYVLYQLDYDQKEFFEKPNKFKNYMNERIIPSKNFIY